jgi:Sec-independent protein translocase protein TatA
VLSVPDMAIIGVVALIFFGPDQLPKVARRAGQIMRDMQNTSQAFIRELERAADEYEPPPPAAPQPVDEGVSPRPQTEPDPHADGAGGPPAGPSDVQV